MPLKILSSVTYKRVLRQLEDNNIILSGDPVLMPTENLRSEFVN